MDRNIVNIVDSELLIWRKWKENEKKIRIKRERLKEFGNAKEYKKELDGEGKSRNKNGDWKI